MKCGYNIVFFFAKCTSRILVLYSGKDENRSIHSLLQLGSGAGEISTVAGYGRPKVAGFVSGPHQ